MSSRSERRAEAERLAQARDELQALYGSLRRAYAVFEHTADPALTEAAVLEIGALQQRCGLALRGLKRMERAAECKPSFRFGKARGEVFSR